MNYEHNQFADDDESNRIKLEMEKMFKEELKNNEEKNLVSDKVMSEIYKKNVCLDDFKQFPKLIINN